MSPGAPRMVQMSGVCADLVYRIRALPRPGEDAIVLAPARLTAGGGFNAMLAARRAGLAVAFAGTLGQGPIADICAAALAEAGIAVLRPRMASMDQGVCTVLVEQDGERSFIASEGADGEVTEADLAGLALHRDDWLLLSGYALTHAGSRAAFTRWLQAHPTGLRLVFDPSPQVAQIPDAARRAALAAALWVSANAAEARFLSGLDDPADAATALAATRPAGGGALVRDGARGCHLALAGGAAIHVAPHPVAAVDTNGAGDAHMGYFIAMLARGEAPARAARLANIAAALATTRHGPATAPDLAAVLAAMLTAAGATRNDNPAPATARNETASEEDHR